MTTRMPADSGMLETAARLAGLELTPVGAEKLVPIMNGVYGMLDLLDQSTLGEAAPAFAFKAKWEI